MIAALITQITSAIGSDIGNRIYSVVAPVNVVFPCCVIERTYTDPYHTKSSTTRKETRIKCHIMAKDSSGTDSAYSIAFNLAQDLTAAINALIVGTTEYRVMDVVDDYNDEVGYYRTSLEIMIQSDYA